MPVLEPPATGLPVAEPLAAGALVARALVAEVLASEPLAARALDTGVFVAEALAVTSSGEGDGAVAENEAGEGFEGIVVDAFSVTAVGMGVAGLRCDAARAG